jgi:hypothetical protein
MSFRVSNNAKVSIVTGYTPLPPGQDTQILTNVNGVNQYSYPGYNFSGSDMFPLHNIDLSGITNITGSAKYCGGVLAPNGNIYCIPFNADNVGIINPITNTFSTIPIPSVLIGKTLKCQGGAIASNGKIYCADANAQTILVINTNNNTTYTIGSSAGAYAWLGAVRATNGFIWLIPCNSWYPQYINPATDEIVPVAFPPYLPDNAKFAGGVLAPNGRIYCIPLARRNFLVIDTSNNTYQETIDISGLISPGSQAFSGGVLAPNGNIYCIPLNATSVIRVDTSSNTAFKIDISGGTLSGGTYFTGGVLAPNGLIYGIPQSSTRMLVIDPVSNTARLDTIPTTLSGTAKWWGGVLAPNGEVFGIPYDSQSVLQVKTGIPQLQPWMLAPHFNKF